MKLEVGMYVRTKLGIIAKCINVLEDCSYDFDRVVYQDNYNEDGFMEFPYLLIDKYVSKFSFNIIDLIEIGDYVNSYKVTHRTKSLLGFEDGQDGDWYLSNENIKSIVTKEQFKSLEYEV
ncbi:MAG TPA: hypothetical protein GX708_11595 [Gallicola sp.]|nr:hypothetical protein [Gallicola sp.]